MRSPARWRKVMVLWEQAAKALDSLGAIPIDIVKFFRAIERVGRKPLKVDFRIQQLDLNFGVSNVLNHVEQLLQRLAGAKEEEGAGWGPSRPPATVDPGLQKVSLLLKEESLALACVYHLSSSS